MWGTLGLGALMVGLAGGAIYVVNLKWLVFKYIMLDDWWD